MIGTKLAHYQITAHLGSGGFGDVYQATDSKLGRSVAIKLLPEAFARDTDRASRFEREARVLASLNHPNIAAIYGLEDANGRKLLVMELVPGETLAERIARGAIPVDEALVIAKQIAEALEAAHEKGVIHRDLKPANVKVTPDGKVKVLDFGLAKAFQEHQETSLSNSPTLMSAASDPGIILGTAAYMSPEQAKGRTVDRRTDIFAFGCVLYEMLTGRRTFDGEDVADIIGAVLKSEPDWTILPANVPSRIQELLRLCLQKDARKRRQTATDVGIDIEQARKNQESAANPGSARAPRWPWTVAAVLAVALGIALLALGLASVAAVRSGEKTAAEMRVDITTPSTSAPLQFALSPDDKYLVFVASGAGPQRLWLRALDKTEAQPMPGTEDAEYPFWSADSRSIGFFARGKLNRIDISGGPPQALASATTPTFGGTWGADGTILFASVIGTGLMRVNASGGAPSLVTRLDPRQVSHRFPQFLPDGRHFLFWAQGVPEAAGVWLGSLDGGEPKRLTASDSEAVYLAPDMILFVRQTALMAAHMDLKRIELTGDPVRVADPIGSSGTGHSGFSASADGRIAYRAGGETLRQLTWYDRTGKALGPAGSPDATLLAYPELSPDGQWIAFQRRMPGLDVWLLNLVRNNMTRLTTDPADDGDPVWSPDGKRVAFASSRNGGYNLYVKSSDNAGAEDLLLATPNLKFPRDWSKDGRFLIYTETDPKTQQDLWALPMAGADQKPFPVVKTPFDESNGQVSPDGHWIAFETNESGRYEIVVQPFPEPGGKFTVSTNGGAQPRWGADGKELFFIAPDDKLMVASIKVSAAALSVGTPGPLFSTRIAAGAGVNRQQYAVSHDGRFLINQPVEESTTAPITLILNWHPEPKK